MNNYQLTQWIICCFFLFSFSSSFSQPLERQDVVIYWNNVLLNRVQVNKVSPPKATRDLFLMHSAALNALAAYSDDILGTTRGSTLRRPVDERTQSNKEEAISFACFRTLLGVYPALIDQAYLSEQLSALGYNPNEVTANLVTPSGIGNTIAFDILHTHAFDGCNQFGNEVGGTPNVPYSDYTDYKPVNSADQLNDPNAWQPLPTPTGEQQYLLPFWGLAQTFAVTSICEFIPPPPALYPSKEYFEQAREILRLSAELDDRTKSIAEYWSDSSGTVTPPGHWNLIAQYVGQRDQYDLEDNVKLFFTINAALCDTGIVVWNVKRYYDSVRPISAIRFLYQDQIVCAWGGPCQGTQRIMGQEFQSYIPTPPFAEYISGHSGFSAAAAEVLKRFTGSDCFGDYVIIPQGSSQIEPDCNVPSRDVILKWNTFTEAADQAGISRRYGGIHFKKGDLESRKIGRKVGAQAFEKALCYINHTPKQIKGRCGCHGFKS